MRHLHAITPGQVSAFVWLIPMKRGRILGRGQYAHIYELHRRSDLPDLPPPDATEYMQNRARVNRYYWLPWQARGRNINVLEPICGPLPTSAEPFGLSVDAYATTNWRAPALCPNCNARSIALRATTISELNTNDPWMNLRNLAPPSQWPLMMDPILGR